MSEAELIQEEAYDPRHSGFLFNVNLIFLSTLGVNLLSFVIVVVIARLLGPDGRGITSLYQTGINFSYAFISFGVSIGALFYVSRREVTPREAMEAGLTATLASAVLSAFAAAVLGLVMHDRLRDAGVPYWLIAAAIPLVVQFRMVEVLVRAQGRFLVVSLIEAGVPLTTLAGLLVVEVLADLTVPRAIAVWTLAPVPSLLIGYAALGPSAWPRTLGAGKVLRRLIQFGVQGQVGNIVQTLNYRLDSYLILLFVNSTGVGLYAVGVALSEGLWLMANSVAIVLIPKLASSDAQYAARTTPLVCRNTILITALGALALGAVSPVAVPLLFGDRFRDAVEPLLWLLPGVVGLSGTKVLSAYVFSQGKPMYNTWISLATLALTLVGDFALIPALGVPGAAIASSAAYLTSLVLTLIVYRRLSGQPASDALLPRRQDAALFIEGARTALARLRQARAGSADAGAESPS